MTNYSDFLIFRKIANPNKVTDVIFNDANFYNNMQSLRPERKRVTFRKFS
jgi:hypothetical protein